ncbi:MAG: hypothetical protein Kow0032_11430 [Methyloligellaceae bacterium]
MAGAAASASAPAATSIPTHGIAIFTVISFPAPRDREPHKPPHTFCKSTGARARAETKKRKLVYFLSSK